MIKKYFTKFPLWFTIIWCLVVLAYIILILTNQNILIMTGLAIVMYVANAIRTWKSERGLAIVSCILVIMFSYILYKFLTL
ncbi:hypothetical protein PMSD_14920 [Paenibacillus macquariensis subsp. defensor]|nr:hypothetical protein PMSD_14920 [Paenibacillus macquariensis subsp. defensor]